MRDALSTYLRARPGSPLSELAEATLARDGELEVQREEGPEHALMGHAEELESAADQLRLELSGYDARGNVRLELARYLETAILPGLGPQVPELLEEGQRRRRRAPLEVVAALPEKLREARRRCWFQMNLEDGGTRTLWDQKAGEPLLCPDDAREESQRLTRRLEGKVGELARQGLRVYFAVLTIENAAPGHLEARIAKLWRKFRRALKARQAPRRALSSPRIHIHAERTCSSRPRPHRRCRRKSTLPPPVRQCMALAGERRPGFCPRRIRAQRRIAKKDLPALFPIVGAIASLEAPLSASRTWHPHLNVILVTRGILDYSRWWQHWGCVSDIQHLKPGNVEAAFRELVKYAVRAVPEKSAAKAAGSSLCGISSPSSLPFSPAPGSGSNFGASPSATSAGMMVSNSAPSTAGASSASTRAPESLSPDRPDGCAAPTVTAGSTPTGRGAREKKAPGPAMVEWTAREWLEWWCAMKGRRRTRTYGELYGLNVDTEEEPGAWVTIGKGWWAGTGYRMRIELLESIPGDKSILNIRTRWEKFLEGLTHPPNYYRELAEQLRSAREHLDFCDMPA